MQVVNLLLALFGNSLDDGGNIGSVKDDLYYILGIFQFENSELVKEELPVDQNESMSFLDTKVRASNT